MATKPLAEFPYEVCFVGAGYMAQAIATSLIKQGLNPSQVSASSPVDTHAKIWRDLGATFTNKNSEVFKENAIVFFAMKPDNLIEAVKKLPRKLPRCIVSMLLGVHIRTIVKLIKISLSMEVPIVRIMPNILFSVGCGVTALCTAENASKVTLECSGDVKKLMESGGICEVVSESMLDVISAVSSSSPAFMFIVIEALADGAVLRGLRRDTAIKLAALAMKGAGEMVLKTGQHPGFLKDEVCSPGGSSIAGIQALEKAGLRSSLINAMDACYIRSVEVSKESKKNEREEPKS